MRRLTTSDFEEILPKLLEFERRSFGDYPYTPAPERLRAWWEAGCFILAGTMHDNGELDSLFTALITTQDEYEKFRDGKIASSKQMQPHPKDDSPALLYIPTLIVGTRLQMPYLFKSIVTELNQALEKIKSHATAVVGTAADKRAIFLMKRFGFTSEATYKDGYQIMRAARNSCDLMRHTVR